MDQGLHRERLNAVMAALHRGQHRVIADLGCGTGNLLQRLLAEPAFERVIGLDVSAGALDEARCYLQASHSPEALQRLQLLHGSFLQPPEDLHDAAAVCLVETIEHLPPGCLGQLADAVWGRLHPECLIVTTPNAEYNCLFDLPPGRFRDPDHRFEWPRARFRHWAQRLASRYGYEVRFVPVGEEDWELGPPTQMAVFDVR
jgi:3' terminal RNA ribose 2'-O-methyltransferase Hen1